MARYLVIASLWLLIPLAVAQEKPADVPSAVQSCAACHGPEGQGVAPNPRIAGLGAAYINRQLNAFASGERISGIMKPIASGLSEQQRRTAAQYFSELPILPGDGDDAFDAAGHPGRTLALHGDWQQGIPACVQCHGPGGRGIGENFPPLARQPASYLENQLKAWRSGDRAAGPMGLMGHIAEQLDEEDLKAVAEYFASLPAIEESNNE